MIFDLLNRVYCDIYVANAVYSSCSGRGVTSWNKNRKTINLEIESWLHSMVSVSYSSINKIDNVISVLYNPVNGRFSKHWFNYNDKLDESLQGGLL